ncbi:Squamosa promoter-binding-like protein 7 [Linum perenne]
MEPPSPPPPINDRMEFSESYHHHHQLPPATESYPIPSSSSPWELSDLLDFNIDDHFPLSFDLPDDNPDDYLTGHDAPPIERVRKRDPRSTCSNFLAGRVPCACPELDEKLEQEEGVPGKKRARVGRGGPGMYRCQVPGCEVDISELKGYHRRHRVCLRCANATDVKIDGETKRYCQQCGKFHLLPDFDEGKRSCRRKLERHNNRRRRKSVNGSVAGNEGTSMEILQADDAAFDGEIGKEGPLLQILGKEALVEIEDGPESQKVNSDSGAASAETLFDAGNDDSSGKYDSKFSRSPSNFDNRTAYSSLCPTGRVSFKLYDWNPAEFPRRLRHQIFQWLASMPVELEAYIRPGCTILTVFTAMPKRMWVKMLEDPLSYVQKFVLVPGSMLSGKGPMIVYVDDLMFRVLKGGTSVMQLNAGMQSPRLHYVHPNCFEAGKPMEFVACGSNLYQSNFRLLVSFDGKYLAYDYCVGLPSGGADGNASRDHQLCKISIPCVDPNIFGPAFIEVENGSGLSNFIPVLVGDKQICSEMEVIQQRLKLSSNGRGLHCEISETRQRILSELIVDVAWLLKAPSQEAIRQMAASSQIQRFVSLLQFLIRHESTFILGKILSNLKIIVGAINVINGNMDADAKVLKQYMDEASRFLHRKANSSNGLAFMSEFTSSGKFDVDRCCSQTDFRSVAALSDEDIENRQSNRLLRLADGSTPNVRSDKIPLLNGDIVMDVNLAKKERPSNSCSVILSNRVLKSRAAMFLIATAAVCVGVCAVLLHPHSVTKIMVSIRSCWT